MGPTRKNLVPNLFAVLSLYNHFEELRHNLKGVFLANNKVEVKFVWQVLYPPENGARKSSYFCVKQPKKHCLNKPILPLFEGNKATGANIFEVCFVFGN